MCLGSRARSAVCACARVCVVCAPLHQWQRGVFCVPSASRLTAVCSMSRVALLQRWVVHTNRSGLQGSRQADHAVATLHCRWRCERRLLLFRIGPRSPEDSVDGHTWAQRSEVTRPGCPAGSRLPLLAVNPADGEASDCVHQVHTPCRVPHGG